MVSSFRETLVTKLLHAKIEIKTSYCFPSSAFLTYIICKARRVENRAISRSQYPRKGNSCMGAFCPGNYRYTLLGRLLLLCFLLLRLLLFFLFFLLLLFLFFLLL